MTLTNPLKTAPIFTIFLLFLLSSISYLIGSYKTNSHTITNTNNIPFNQTSQCTNLTTLHFEPTHLLTTPLKLIKHNQLFRFCAKNFTHYCPCQDTYRSSLVIPNKSFHKERHCPGKNETLRCLVPRPEGYKRPFPWPESKKYARFRNVPFPELTVIKKDQNWVRLEENGSRLVFPGGGTSFPKGVKEYIDKISKFVPLKSGNIRTALDVGCGVASFASGLTDFDIVTMSIAPSDVHEAQVQFALERGLPAMLGVLSIYRLPFPARSFDMAHCSRCLVPWTSHDGVLLMEIDRVLRPGGYWILSGPPIGWRISYKGWERTTEDLENEQNNLEDLTRRLCWKKIGEQGPVAVWQKPNNHMQCAEQMKKWRVPKFCADGDQDAGWYKRTQFCISPLPKVKKIRGVSGGALEKWPKRLNTAPPRSRSEGISLKAFRDDNQIWKRRVLHYKSVLKSLSVGGYRNVMDMNAGIGGFAAALHDLPVWVMNVVPFDSKNNTLGIIYERGLIGTYINWCEPFSTYPRTYDFIHADSLFTMYTNKCDVVDILFEINRILRPHGAVVIRDHVDIIMTVKSYMDQMRWKYNVSHSLEGPLHTEKILFIENDVSPQVYN